MAGSRSLLPREYGAYAELAFPILTGLIAGGLTPAAAGFVVAAVAGFLVHEPVLILHGTRGDRLRRALGPSARARIGVLLVAGAAGAAVGMAAAPAAVRLAALVPAGGLVLLLPSVVRGRTKTLAAELIMAAAFSTMLLPIAAASGVDRIAAWSAVVVWFTSFGLATLVVHAVKAAHNGGGTRWIVIATPALALIVALAAVGLSWRGTVPALVGLAAVPTPLVVLAVAAIRVHPRNLRRVGWSLLGANVLTLALLLLA